MWPFARAWFMHFYHMLWVNFYCCRAFFSLFFFPSILPRKNNKTIIFYFYFRTTMHRQNAPSHFSFNADNGFRADGKHTYENELSTTFQKEDDDRLPLSVLPSSWIFIFTSSSHECVAFIFSYFPGVTLTFFFVLLSLFLSFLAKCFPLLGEKHQPTRTHTLTLVKKATPKGSLCGCLISTRNNVVT